jgi:hypothetical protein
MEANALLPFKSYRYPYEKNLKKYVNFYYCRLRILRSQQKRMMRTIKRLARIPSTAEI